MARSLRDTIEALRRSVSAVIDGSVLPPGAPGFDEDYRHGFRIGATRLLHGLTRDVELVEMMPAYALPNTANWCLGLVNLRGRLIPVYDLKPLLEGAQAAGTSPKLLISGADDFATGLVIDGTPSPVPVGPDSLVADDSIVPAVLRAATRAVYRIGEETWVEPDYDALFGDLAARAAL